MTTELCREIHDTWTMEDVQEVRPDLSEEQCSEVLKATIRDLDANIGINWDVICFHADMLYPQEVSYESL
jgi:hypothetical protein